MAVQEKTNVEGLATDLGVDPDKTRYAAKPNSSIKHSTASPTVTIHEGMLIKDRYLLENKIGSGGMSDIYRATDLFLQNAGVVNCTVAIKVLQQQFVDQAEALQLLLQEAHKTQQLSHPNIVRVFDVDCDQQHYFIVMEFLDGESLEQVIKRYKPKGLPLKSALKLLQQIADALNFAHKSGIVHADLKPANIMVNRAGEIKVLDFGVSQKLQLNHDIYAAEQQSQTAPLSGYTPAYASPQLLSGNSPCVADDLFSFACLSYELLCSKHPFDRIPADKALQQNKQAKKPAHLNLLQWRALKRGLQFDSNKRNTRIADIIKQFKQSIWQPSVAAAALCALGFAGWQYHQQLQMEVSKLTNQSNAIQQQQLKYQQLANVPATELLAAIAQFDNNTLETEGLIRLQQNAVLQYFEQQIDSIISDRNFTYPNYPEIERLLTQANTLYPDSHYLADISTRMLRSKQTAIEVLRSQLSQQLLNKQYQPQSSELDPYKIIEELHRVDSNYRVEPDDAEAAIYVAAFNQAISSNDALALQQLIGIGKLLFSRHDDTAALVEKSQQLAQAVDTMAIYSQALADGKSPEFPYSAAHIFYQHSFNLMQDELESSNKPAEVDGIYDKLKLYKSLVPSDFPLNVALRRKLADKYLSLSTELLKSNQVRTAERLMLRANELMSSINS